MMTISILRIPLSLESMEEINAKKGIQKVHSEHPEQCKWQLNALSEFGSIPDELGSDEKVSSSPCYNVGDQIKNPFCHYNFALGIANTCHPPHFPHVQKDRMQLSTEIEISESVSCRIHINNNLMKY